MTKGDILGKIQNILAELVDQDDLQISEKTTADDVDGWDSINQVKLLIAIESELGIRFETNEVDGMKNVGEMITVIERKL